MVSFGSPPGSDVGGFLSLQFQTMIKVYYKCYLNSKYYDEDYNKVEGQYEYLISIGFRIKDCVHSYNINTDNIYTQFGSIRYLRKFIKNECKILQNSRIKLMQCTSFMTPTAMAL